MKAQSYELTTSITYSFYPNMTTIRYVRVFAIANPHVVSVVCLSSVTFVRLTHTELKLSAICFRHFVPYSLAILSIPCKNLRRSSHGNPSIGGVKRKRSSKLYRAMSRSGVSSRDEFLVYDS